MFVLLLVALVIGLPLACFVQFATFRTRIERLEGDLRRLERATPQVTPAPQAVPEPQVMPEPQAMAALPQPAQVVPEREPLAAGFVAEPRYEPEPEPAHASKQILNWELFAGGRLLNVIGAIILVIGVGLFLKYAFDQNWITVAMRVAGGVLLGAGLLAFGEVCHRSGRQRWFSQGIIGAGIGVLYVSGHAAFANYHLVPFAAAYAFMSLVTVAAFLLALRYDALSIALIAWLGGFVTPFVLNEGVANEIGLASYIVLLDIGIVAIGLLKKRWAALEPLALAASYVAAAVWYSQNADASSWFVSIVALLSLWLVFFGASIVNALRAPKSELEAGQLLGIVNALCFWGSAAVVLHGHDAALQVVLASAAGAYALAYALVLVREPACVGQRVIYYLSGLAFLFGWTWLHFPNPYASAVASALEAIVLVTLDTMARRRLAIASEEASIGVSLMLAWQCVLTLDTHNPLIQSGLHFDFAFGGRDIAVAAVGVAFLAIQALVASRPAAGRIGGLRPVLRIAAAVALAAFSAAHFQGFALADAYALEALVLIVLGARGMLRDIEVTGLVFLGAAAISAAVAPDAWFYERIFGFDPWHNGRLLATGVLAAVAILAGEVIRRRSLLPGSISRMLRIAGAAVAVTGLTLQVRDHIELARALSALDTTTAAAQAHTIGLGHLEQLAISGAWVVSSLVLIGLGITLRLRDLRLMAIALFVLTIGKAFLYDLGTLTELYRIAAFIGLGIVLLGVSYIYVRLERGTLPGDRGDASLGQVVENPV